VLGRHGGHANKFIGDGLLGVFGAPEAHPDHADRALAAALEIAVSVRERYGTRLRIGIGLNSGTVVAGTIGGGGRIEFTVIGDAVNTAARVEEATRITGDEVLLTEATRSRLRADHGGFVGRGDAELKGKTARVRLHAPLAVAAASRAVRLRAI
jgi:adenylate cyclase